MNVSLREIARDLGGEVSGVQVLAPGPNHDRRDRSLSVKISASSPEGFIVHSFAGDSFEECRDYVKARLGIERSFPPRPIWAPENTPRMSETAGTLNDDESRRIERARAIWRESIDPRGTIVETYWRSRALELDGDLVGRVLRFHAACPWRDKDADKTIFVPAMVAVMRSIATDEITAIHRTRLSTEGVKLDRRMLGVANGAAIKLNPDDTVTGGLAIGEGIETCASALQLGIRPTWALGSTSFVSAFPVLAGVECLTILAENDAASAKALDACAMRWHSADREVLINRSTCGKDLNDAIRGAA
jgi:putative DNA primase/helicase